MINSRNGSRRDGRHPRRRSTTKLIACAITCAATALSLSAAAGYALADPGGTAACPRWTAVLVPGTGETGPTADPGRPAGLLSPIGDGLAARFGADIAVRYLPYPATPVPYMASKTTGVEGLRTLLGGLCESSQVVLAGYSQGADAAGEVASQIGRGAGPIPADRVLAVGLLSDPHRDPATAQLGGDTAGEGIGGLREDFGQLSTRVRTVCAQGDLYCSTSEQTSPVLAAMGRAFTGNGTLIAQSSTAAMGSVGTSGLEPASVVRQVAIVAGGLTGVAANIPAILDGLTQLPNALAAADLPRAHQIVGELNNAFNPLVRMASQVDLHMVAQALSMAAPLDSSGTTAAAAQIVDILARVDITRVATDLGTGQEIAWRATQKATAGDWLGSGLDLVGLVPIAADLAATTAQALTGQGAGQLTSLASNMTTPTDPATADPLAELARQGGEAATFYGSGVHQSGYTDGVREVLGYLIDSIERAR
ncbi:cutinase family protein [Nocardia sp. NBC_01499]|uniref:cutinase family protein n=1 Tax=Nocardia sp. NBC_01499 TaxID=2903597 RepID=UPI00386DF40A